MQDGICAVRFLRSRDMILTQHSCSAHQVALKTRKQIYRPAMPDFCSSSACTVSFWEFALQNCTAVPWQQGLGFRI